MEDIWIYQDKNLKIALPSYLKAKKKRYFVADPKLQPNPAMESVAIDMPYDLERAGQTIKILSQTMPFLEWNGVTMKTIRMGDVFLNGKGFELLHESFRSDTSVYVYRYDRIFCLVEGLNYAHAIFSLSGSIDQVGPIDDFHRLSCKIVESAEMI